MVLGKFTSHCVTKCKEAGAFGFESALQTANTHTQFIGNTLCTGLPFRKQSRDQSSDAPQSVSCDRTQVTTALLPVRTLGMFCRWRPSLIGSCHMALHTRLLFNPLLSHQEWSNCEVIVPLSSLADVRESRTNGNFVRCEPFAEAKLRSKYQT